MLKSLVPAVLLLAVSAAAESPYPHSASEVPPPLRYPAGAPITGDRDGNYRVDGKIRWLLGTQPPSGYSRSDVLPRPADPPELNWIYRETLDYDSAQRLGFDTLFPYTSCRFINQFAPGHRRGRITEDFKEALAKMLSSGLPLVVDYTATPWNQGSFNSKDPELRKHLADEALNAYHLGEGNHWVAYNVFHPDARKILRAMWEDGVREFEGKSPILAYELFNEPAYNDPGPYNRKLFAEYLAKRYRTIAVMNRVYDARYASFEEAANFKNKNENAGLAVDWCKFMEEGFTDLCRFGAETITRLKPDARTSVQPGGNAHYRQVTRNHVNPYEINQFMAAISLPTAGGISPRGGDRPAERAIDTPANSPNLGEGLLQRHFYRATSEGKPILNGELYVGNDANTIRNRFWLDLLRGVNASYAFSWSKRAWDWQDEASGRRRAEIEPYAMVNPYNRTDFPALMAVKKEIFRFGEFFMPRDRGVSSEVAILISYPTERRSEAIGNLVRNEVTAYAAALDFSHFGVDAILEEQLPGNRQQRYRAIVAVGVRNIYPATAKYLLDYVKAGGTLILAREFMSEDEYGHPVDWQGALDFTFERDEKAPTAGIKMKLPNPELLPGALQGRNTRRITRNSGWEILAETGGAPTLLTRKIGKGSISLVTPEMQDYQIAAQLQAVLGRAGIRPRATLRRAAERDLAVNIELHPARRGSRTAWFLFNHDNYPKLVDFKPEARGPLFDLLNSRTFTLTADGSARVLLPAFGYAILGSGPEAEFAAFAPFAPADPAAEKVRFDEALAATKKRQEELEAGRFRYRPDLARTRTLDLRKFCNRGFLDSVEGDGKGGWTDQGRENSLTGVPWGVHNLLGVPCDLIRFDENDDKTCIVLASKSQKGALPEKVEGIPVGGRVRALYFFHTAAWVGLKQPAMTYRIHYRSGKSLDVTAVCGRDIGNWWLDSSTARINAWRNTQNRGFQCMEWVNPTPEDEVATLDILSPDSTVVPIVIAITAEAYTPVKTLAWQTLTVAPWGKLKGEAASSGGEIVVSAESDLWAGFICRPKSAADAWKPTPEEWKEARLVFEINGGLDRFGNHKGGQLLGVTLRGAAEGKPVASERIDLRRLLDRAPIDSDPESWQEASIPLREFKKADVLNGVITGVGFQFLGTGNIAGVAARNFRLIIPTP